MASTDRAHTPAMQIEVGTALESAPEDRQAFLEALDRSVDPELLQGAFATNVWGGRYEIEGLLKKGGQGTTFHGTDRKTGAKVVAKVLDLKHAKDWKRLELFEREIATLKRLDDHGLPRFLDVIEEPSTGARALVMTRVPGTAFDERVRTGGPLGEKDLWRVLLDTTRVLAELHSASPPLVHRDVKPANLIERPDGRVALVDLGGVGHVRSEGGSTVVGTFGYMAPEQIYGATSPRMDLYALGATLLMLATGQEPESMPRRGLSIDVDKAAPHLSPELRAVLTRLVAAEPDQRPEDARALARELLDRARRKPEPAPEPPGLGQDPRTDAVFPSEIDVATHTFTGVIALVIGVLGTIAAVAVGEVILPVVLTVLATFAQGEQRARLLKMRTDVQRGARVAREGFAKSIERGARALEEADVREKRRRLFEKDRKKLERQREKELRRQARVSERRRW